jgi:hypothetical protein
LANGRGIGWQYGIGCYIPREWQDTSNEWTFILQSLRTIFFAILIAESIIRQFPEIYGPNGSMLFMFGKNVFEKYAVFTMLHCSFAILIFSHTAHSNPRFSGP